MKEYHKIQTVYKRNAETNYKTLLENEFSLPEFEYLKDNQWVFTEKVDGTNIRIKYQDGKVTFGGRTDNAQLPTPLFERLTELFPINIFNQVFQDTDVCLYGEGYGGKIQKAGSTYGQNQDFVLFDILINDSWLQRENIEDIASKMNIAIVPILCVGTLSEMVQQAREGITSSWGDFQAEGYVARPTTEIRTRSGHRIITKIKCKDFLS